MPELHENLEREIGGQTIRSTEIPPHIRDNLNPKFKLRPYQKEAFARYLLFKDKDFARKPEHPYHLLFHMATGSGKTLIMAGLMLDLYRQGYRNFLFFVNSNNVIDKTKDNFLNEQSAKYLFSERLHLDDGVIEVRETDYFHNSSETAINVCFTTIQKLHYDMNTPRENGITLDDFAQQKTALLADEAHHLQTETKQQRELFNSWETTVQKILECNRENILLEFTATLDMKSPDIRTKYEDKRLFVYDLKSFRADGYSKEIDLLESDADKNLRILQTLVLSEYRRRVALDHQLDIKPVILFKENRRISSSNEDYARFCELIENLKQKDIDDLRNDLEEQEADTDLKRAFEYFEKRKKERKDVDLVGDIRREFGVEHCMNVNETNMDKKSVSIAR